MNLLTNSQISSTKTIHCASLQCSITRRRKKCSNSSLPLEMCLSSNWPKEWNSAAVPLHKNPQTWFVELPHETLFGQRIHATSTLR